MDFLVTMTTHVPQGTTRETVAEVRQREAAHSHGMGAVKTRPTSQSAGACSVCGGPH